MRQRWSAGSRPARALVELWTVGRTVGGLWMESGLWMDDPARNRGRPPTGGHRGPSPVPGRIVHPQPTLHPQPTHSSTHRPQSVSYTHLRAHETVLDLVCRLLLE